jgi:hypothetical protein
VFHINISRHAAPAAPECVLGACGGEGGLFFAAGGAHLAFQVDIPLDPAPSAVHGLATNRAKHWLRAASAFFVHHIHIPRHAAPSAPECALRANGGKGGLFFVASGAHLVHQVDIPLDPAPSAVHGLATNRAKRRPLAAPALFVRYIHISRNAAPTAPDRLFSAGAGKRSAFLTAHGAIARHLFFCFVFLFSV